MQLLQTNCTLKAAALCLLVGTAALAAEPAVTPATPASSTIASKAPAPKIQFSELTYDFGKADSGTLIKHIYVFTNSGDAILEITGVKPGCGCTTAGDWDKRVEPTKTGTIPIQFNSAGY